MKLLINKLIIHFYKLFFADNISKPDEFKKILSNSGWLIFEKLFRFAFTFTISIVLARYLRPHSYGVFTYYLALLNIFSIFIQLGLRIIVINEILLFPDKTNKILGSAFFAKIFGSILAFILICFLGRLYINFEPENYYVLLTLCLIFFFRPFEVISFYFEAKLKSVHNVNSKNIALFVAFLLNIFFVVLKLDLIFFAIVLVIESVIISLLYIVNYSKYDSILAWRFDWQQLKLLIGKSWFLILSGSLALIYTKIDRVMINFLYSTEEVGIYSVASNLSEAWYFIPAALIYSFYPQLSKLKKNNSIKYFALLQKIFDFLFVAAFFIALIITLTGNKLVNIFYGAAYYRAGFILAIHIWSGIFIFMRELYEKWLVIENKLKFVIITHATGAIINIAFNSLLIPNFGGYGAAVATLISFSTASYLVLFIFKDTRIIAIMMTKSILMPCRVLIKSLK